MLEKRSVKPEFANHILTLAETKLKSLVATHMHKITLEARNNLAQIIIQKCISPFHCGAYNLSPRAFRNIVKASLAQSIVHMTKTLLLRHKLHMIFFAILHEFLHLFRRNHSPTHVNLRILLRFKDILSVYTVAVNLIF